MEPYSPTELYYLYQTPVRFGLSKAAGSVQATRQLGEKGSDPVGKTQSPFGGFLLNIGALIGTHYTILMSNLNRVPFKGVSTIRAAIRIKNRGLNN